MKTRYFIFISFKGSSYHGWQVQPNSVTVQKVIEDTLSTILGESIITTGAGRTDTGVHALVFCAHFDSEKPDLAEKKNILFRLNRFLPKDISASGIIKVRPDAHARFSAISRTYSYFISRIKDPFREDSSWFIHGDLDIKKMNEACELLLRNNDFTSFSKLHSDVKTNLCTVYSANWNESESRMIFTIRADRFLRNMVRAIVGTMVEIGTGKLAIQEFESIIHAKDRSRAGKSAPAKGLFLTEIEYPAEIYPPSPSSLRSEQALKGG